MLVDNFDLINIIQKEGIVNSGQFPEVDFDQFKLIVDKMFKNLDYRTYKDLPPIKDHELERIFMRATRNDNEENTKGALCRAELLEAIVRLSEKLGLYEFRVKPSGGDTARTVSVESSIISARDSDDDEKEEVK